jgi:exopolysaccharide biosynthesis glucuronosyltransferase PssE
MILVATGTNGPPFDRLLRAVDELDLDEEIVVQYGPSDIRPRRARCVDYVGFDELAALVRQARSVVTHGGVGTILLALMNGRRPIVVPRLARFREVVDDHQLVLARRLGEEGLVTVLEDPKLLRQTLSEPDARVLGRVHSNGSLGTELGEYLKESVGSATYGQ